MKKLNKTHRGENLSPEVMEATVGGFIPPFFFPIRFIVKGIQLLDKAIEWLTTEH